MKMRWFLILCLTLLALPILSMAELTVHFLDVGQGDAAVLLCDGEAMLIDGGKSAESQFIFSYLRNTLGLSHLKCIVSTHPHEDHAGGLAAALNACTVETVYSPVTDYDSRPFQSLLKYARKQACALTVPQRGDAFQLGGAVVTFLSSLDGASGVNDLSIVLRVDYGETSFLFTGDAEQAAEGRLLTGGADLHADVLKVAHHGSDTSSSRAFLEAVHPGYAVISVEKDNPYGHPSDWTLTELRARGCTVLRTDLYGTIICRSDGQSLTFQTEKNPRKR